MALVDAPHVPLRDVHLRGGLRSLVLVIATMRMVLSIALVTTYFQSWHRVWTAADAVIDQTGWSRHRDPVPVLLAVVVSILAFRLFVKPTLSRGMISAAASAACAVGIFWTTLGGVQAGSRVEPQIGGVIFGASFVLLALTGVADLVFHPILYIWSRRAQAPEAPTS
jgi:hypothetical protein